MCTFTYVHFSTTMFLGLESKHHDHCHFYQIYIVPLLNGQPLLSGQFSKCWEWPLNRGPTVINKWCLLQSCVHLVAMFHHQSKIWEQNMYLQWLLAFITFTSVNGVTRVIKPNFKALNFAKEIRGKRLNRSIIRGIVVDSEGSCGLQCVEENGCLSYNFGLSENKKRFKCQLSDSDLFVGLKNFTAGVQFIYRGVKVISLKLESL